MNKFPILKANNNLKYVHTYSYGSEHSPTHHFDLGPTNAHLEIPNQNPP